MYTGCAQRPCFLQVICLHYESEGRWHRNVKIRIERINFFVIGPATLGEGGIGAEILPVIHSTQLELAA